MLGLIGVSTGVCSSSSLLDFNPDTRIKTPETIHKAIRQTNTPIISFFLVDVLGLLDRMKVTHLILFEM